MICIDSWKPLAGKATADNALAQMKSEIAAYTAGTTAAKYPTYIGGCIWSSIDWIARTYDTSTLELGTMTALEMNEQLRKFKVKIGSGVYYL